MKEPTFLEMKTEDLEELEQLKPIEKKNLQQNEDFANNKINKEFNVADHILDNKTKEIPKSDL